jgi:cytidine deaminase
MRLSGPTNEELINDAASVINPKIVGNRLFGDVGCALITRGGNLYLGVCIDTASGTGFLKDLLPRHEWPEPLA